MATTTTNLGLPLPADSDYVKDGAAQIRLSSNTLETRAGNQWPLFTATNSGAVSCTNATQSNVVGFTFPTGRFSQPPNIFFTHTVAGATQPITPVLVTRTASAVSMYLIQTGSITYTGNVFYFAVQHTSSSANG